MWNSMKSIQLSLICNRLVAVLMVACMVALPKIMEGYAEFYPTQGANAWPLVVILYACCVPAAAALFCLDKLLMNIRRADVFTSSNVSLLRIISWCCFIAAVIVACGAGYYLLFAIMAVIAGFMGLILRVVKNVIEHAAEIKAENDFTI